MLALVVASSLAVLGFFITRPAFAGTNGQELQVCQKTSEDYQTTIVQGNDQDGEVAKGDFSMTQGGCGITTGYLWVGDVEVILYNSIKGLPDRIGSCNVPKEGESPFTCNL